MPLNSFFWGQHHLTKNQTKALQKKGKLQACITDKCRCKNYQQILVNKIQQYIKRIIHHHQVDLFQGCKDGSNPKINETYHINTLKTKNPMIISRDAEKAFDTIKHIFRITTLNKVVVQRNIPQHNKGHMGQTYSQHHTQWWKAESVSSKIRDKIRMPTLATVI